MSKFLEAKKTKRGYPVNGLFIYGDAIYGYYCFQEKFFPARWGTMTGKFLFAGSLESHDLMLDSDEVSVLL